MRSGLLLLGHSTDAEPAAKLLSWVKLPALLPAMPCAFVRRLKQQQKQRQPLSRPSGMLHV
jgi:hypothetical protein